ncbi:hypothetical protein KCP76_14155 [Salmonella enterica subsp. enterica serovar Weltevreden]|nr:hypothetical protein KCP76_14155 [Salmonella enterica subsp. enterica serovar Weltevreden]
MCSFFYRAVDAQPSTVAKSTYPDIVNKCNGDENRVDIKRHISGEIYHLLKHNAFAGAELRHDFGAGLHCYSTHLLCALRYLCRPVGRRVSAKACKVSSSQQNPRPETRTTS